MAPPGTTVAAPVIRDPVSRVRYVVEDHGEDGVVVDTWIEPGGALPPHLHPVQEEVWTVVVGKVRFRLGSGERVIAPEDGTYIIVARESAYAGNANCLYRLHVGNFPRPTATVPAGGKVGETVAVRWIGDVMGETVALASGD